jgi:predicted nuclease of predicted toxin-antitoxin system
MRFVVDAQLPPQLVDWLKSKGHDASHALLVLGEGQSDAAVVAHAAGGVIISKDGDFLGLLEGRADAPNFFGCVAATPETTISSCCSKPSGRA